MPNTFHRRNFCKLTGAATLGAWLNANASTPTPLHVTAGHAIAADGTTLSPTDVAITLRWSGSVCRPSVKNLTSKPLRLREVVLLTYSHSLDPATWVYGESFQMLTQTTGTLASLHEIGYGEQEHYRIPGPTDAAVVTSLLTLSPPNRDHLLLAFTSCSRFVGRFYLRPGSISVVVDTEGLELAPGETWQLEEFTSLSGNDRNALLTTLADSLTANHPNRKLPPVPTGWCSWYCFSRQVTATTVIANLDAISKQVPSLKYIQIDDGYQPAMGDWLDPGTSFGGRIQDVLREIKKRGFEPAIWVAPFIAGPNSRILREHPDWFVQSHAGKPMAASDVTFTGWGGGGWRCLDGTHPEVQQHLEHVFRVMREEWGVTYFKLDANFWGAVHGGLFHDPAATRVQAYRRGMEAVRRGAGDAFLLGCNQPIWPSIGLIDGSRSSGDISRKWKNVAGCSQESLLRNWQNGRLWWNDPDAVLLTDRPHSPMQGTLTEEEFRFHATSAYAAGGLILSGDDLTSIPADRLKMLRELLPPTGAAAIFDDSATLEIGRITTPQGQRIAVFNRSDETRTISVQLRSTTPVHELWTGQQIAVHQNRIALEMPPHSGRLLTL